MKSQSSFNWLLSNYFLLIIIAFGLVLRLIWAGDMEWKNDEKWMFSHSQESAKTGHFLDVGMESGGGIVNPGFSVAVFSAAARFVHTPVGMVRVVQWSNVICIVCFLLFIFFKIEEDQRDNWLWGLALASVSPLAVLFSRKIWAQDVLPLFCFLVILGNAYRKIGWGAFLWGLSGALIGQIHMSGFFYSAGLIAFTFFYDYKNKRTFKWGYWLTGNVVGSLGLIPWIIYIFKNPEASSMEWSHLLEFNFYLVLFFDMHGINTMYSLRSDFWDFIRQPIVGGCSTYGVALLNIFLACTGFYTIRSIWIWAVQLMQYLKRRQLFVRLSVNLSSTDFYLLSMFAGMGILLNFSGIFFCTHYLIVAFPFTYVLLSKIFQFRRKLLFGIIIAQFLVSLSFLYYIHIHGGASNGDYGVSYSAQP